jgi:hypothetical protein
MKDIIVKYMKLKQSLLIGKLASIEVDCLGKQISPLNEIQNLIPSVPFKEMSQKPPQVGSIKLHSIIGIIKGV